MLIPVNVSFCGVRIILISAELSGFLWFILGAFISLVVAYIFYNKAKLAKEPMYDVRSFNVIRDSVTKYEKLSVMYANKKISNLTISKFLFWNAGRGTIRGDDIAAADPLCVECKEKNTVFESKILAVNEPANNFALSISPDNQQVIIGFDYVDYEQGIVFQIIHTGNSSKELDFKGKIKGASRIGKRTITSSSKSSLGDLMGWTGILALVSIGGGAGLAKVVESLGLRAWWVLYLFILLSALLFYWIFRILDKRITVPKGLDSFIN